MRSGGLTINAFCPIAFGAGQDRALPGREQDPDRRALAVGDSVSEVDA